MKDASSDSRKQAARATSSGSPRRPSGVASSAAAPLSGNLREVVRRERRSDQSRRDGVHRGPQGTPFEGQCSGESEQASLGRDVRRSSRRRVDGRHGARDHDACPTGRKRRSSEHLERDHRAVQVRVKDTTDVGIRKVECQVSGHRARVGDDAVRRESSLLQLTGRGLELGANTDVGNDRLDPSRVDQVLDVGEPSRSVGRDRDSMAAREQLVDHGRAEPSGPAHDKDRPSACPARIVRRHQAPPLAAVVLARGRVIRRCSWNAVRSLHSSRWATHRDRAQKMQSGLTGDPVPKGATHGAQVTRNSDSTERRARVDDRFGPR